MQAYVKDTFPEVKLLGQRVNAFAVLITIVELPSMGRYLFPHSFPSKGYCQICISAKLIVRRHHRAILYFS